MRSVVQAIRRQNYMYCDPLRANHDREEAEEHEEDENAQEERVGAPSDDDITCAGIGICCCCCCCIVLLILILCSLRGLDALDYGLTRNTFSGSVDLVTVYHGGRHFLGFWKEFVTFPATLQLLAWTQRGSQDPFLARTKEGNMVTLAVTVQYKLVEAQVGSLYKDFKMSYENYVISNIKSGFQDVVAKYTVEELWTNRLGVVGSLKEACDEVMAVQLKQYTTCWGVQLHDLTLDPVIEQRIEDRQVQEQTQASEKQKQMAAKIRAQTQVDQSRWDLQIKVVNATAAAQATMLTQEAESNAQFNRFSAQAQTLQYTKENLVAGGSQLTSTQLNDYFYAVATLGSKGSNLVYGDFASQSIYEY